MTIFKTIRKYFILFLKKYLSVALSCYINNNMKYRYFQYSLKPTKEQRKTLEFYGSATRWVWNHCLKINQASLNIQREEINILNWTETVQIQAREDTSGGDVVSTSSHVSMNCENFLSTGKEAVHLKELGNS